MENNIYCYYVSDVSRLSEFVVSMESLRATNPKYPIACLVPPDIYESKYLENFLIKIGVMVLKNNKPLSEMIYIDDDAVSCWSCSGKLELLRYYQFNKICYLDTDTYVVKNIDDIFDYPTSYCAGSHMITSEINGGVMVLTPNSDLYSKYLLERDIGYYRKSFNFKFDQNFLEYYIDKKNLTILPYQYNAIVPNLTDNNISYFNDIKIYHFGCSFWKFENQSFEYIKEFLYHNIDVINIVKNYLLYYNKVIDKYKKLYPYIPLANTVNRDEITKESWH